MFALIPILLIAVAALFVGVGVILPLIVVLTEALRHGFGVVVASVTDPAALSAIKLTLVVTAIVVPLNTGFGLVAAWSLGKFRFRGRRWVLALIELPFAVSPVVAGLVFVLLFGAQGWFGEALAQHHVRILFALPGIVLATLFVTFPLVARELVTLAEEQGRDEELAALTLGASTWQTFWRVTVPNLRSALFYGVVLCTARCLGEFGAVSVVSGHIRGQTNTLPLHIEALYNDYHLQAAYALSALLALVGMSSLLFKPKSRPAPSVA